MTVEVYNSISLAIKRELKRLGVEPWIRPIQAVINNFKGCPIDCDESLPEIEILVVLKSLRPAADPNMLFYSFLNRVMNLDCFTYRANRISESGPVYWDPLNCSLDHFKSAGGVSVYQADTLYPAPDIIKCWFSYNLRMASIAQ